MDIRSRLGWRLAAMGLALVISTAAQAAEKCTDSGFADAQARSLVTTGDEGVGLTVAFMLALNPPSFPAEDIAKAAQPCERMTFTIGGNTYVVRGSNSASPPRWAVSNAQPDRIAYLAVSPGPASALDWYRRYERDNNTPAHFGPGTDTIYILAVTSGSKRIIYGYWSKLPDDARLADAMCKALTGAIPVLAVWDVDTMESDFVNKPGAVAPGTCTMN